MSIFKLNLTQYLHWRPTYAEKQIKHSGRSHHEFYQKCYFYASVILIGLWPYSSYATNLSGGVGVLATCALSATRAGSVLQHSSSVLLTL